MNLIEGLTALLRASLRGQALYGRPRLDASRCSVQAAEIPDG
jgi:hypothetical protein